MFATPAHVNLTQYRQEFSLERSAPSPTGDGVVEIYRHERLGFPVLAHRCADNNKFFCAGFQTPHHAADGLPHVLEHIVLAGSKEFPIADPFFSTAKGSFKTYLNATTYPEETYYPVASTVERELFHLCRIYLDAIFHPLLTTSAFRREGWRLESNKDGAPVFNGVVFNEMKGAYSDPESALYYSLCAELFRDTQRGQSSGGDPASIPLLTAERLREFHRDHYHPSQAFVVVHGNIGEEGIQEFLDLIGEKVAGFEPRPIVPALKQHTPQSTPRVVEREFPVEASSKLGLPFTCVGWAIGPMASPEELLIWNIIENVVVGSSSAPLRREILESGLASGLVMSGVSASSLDAFFSIGGQDVSLDRVDGFERHIIESLTQLVQEGFPQDEVAATLHELDFSLKRDVGSSTQGLRFAYSVLRPWMHGKEPFEYMDPAVTLSKVRDLLAANPRYLEDVVRKYLLDNPDRVFLKLRPSHEAYERAQLAEKAQVEAYVSSIGPDGVAREAALNKEMLEERARRDDSAVLARMPRLRPSDLPAEIDSFLSITRSVEQIQGRPVVLQSAKTAGIVYTRLAFNLAHLPASLLGYAPIVSSMIANVDTDTRGFIEVDRSIRQRTGGINSHVMVSPLANGLDEGAYLVVTGSAVSERMEDLFHLMREVSFFSHMTDPTRLREVVREEIAATELDLIESGSSYAVEEALAALSPMYRSSSLLDGYGQLRFLKILEKRIESEWELVKQEIEEFSKIFNVNNMTTALCGEGHNLGRLGFFAEHVLERSPRFSTPLFPDLWDLPVSPTTLGVESSMDVAFIAAAGPLPYEVRSLGGKMLVAKRAISYDYLIPEIRQKHGAYGATSFYHGATGVFGASTYRSKKALIREDVQTLLDSGAFLSRLAVSESDVGKLAVGAAAEYVPYEHPGTASGADFARFLLGVSDEARREVYRQIVSCTVSDIRQVAELFADYKDNVKVRVFTSADALRESGIETATY